MLGTHLLTTHSVPVQRTARIAVLGSGAPDVRELWYVLHGYGSLATDFLGDFVAIDDGTRMIVAPEALSRFYLEDVQTRVRNRNANAKIGASWMTKHERDAEIEDYIAYLNTVHRDMHAQAGGQAKVTVLGFSQGAAAASRWVAAGGVNAARLVIWGSSIAPDIDLAAAGSAIRRPETVIVTGTRDQFATAKIIDAEFARMRAANFPFRSVSFDGGHRMDHDTLRALTQPAV
jgi:predicted esterase